MMKHCEKCLYYEKCKAEMDEAPDDIFTFFPYNEDCPHFKNKADFVKVVRCKNCTHRVDYCGRLMCGRLKYEYKDGVSGLVATVPEHFCSYGEKKDVSKME